MSRPRTQESLQKVKSTGPPGDLRSRSTCTSSEGHEKAVAEISMRDFLDFLKISYQVNEAIDNPSLDVTEKGSVDWKKLTSDALISRLKERESLLNQQKIEKLNSECQEKSEDPPNTEAVVENNESNNCQAPKNVARPRSEEKISGKKLLVEKVTNNLSNQSSSSTLSLDRKMISDKSALGKKKIYGFKKEGSTESETSRSFDSMEERAPARLLKKKLNEVLQEGILDSVLPYLLPKHQHLIHESTQVPSKKSSVNDLKKNIGGSNEKFEKAMGANFKEKMDLKKRCIGGDMSDKNEKKDVEVVIHVCDEIKNLKKDFRCSQKLLLSQMGYFAEVTAGQKLEDMDISVHCDVIIFDWLMKWIQKSNSSEDHWPILDPIIAIPILMSSAFLQINVLHEYCLQYSQKHINDIVRDSPNLNCLNDNALTRLASLFSNTGVENIVDKKDKIQSKLFCKLIASLTEPEPQPSRGHFSSLATIFRCSKCLKLILKNMSNSIKCVSSNLKMNRYGSVYSIHVYDSSWNLTDYVRELKANLKSWRKVYWRLWADCHFLFCQVCEEYFSVSNMSWCRFHVESQQYFPIDSQRAVFHSTGRYPCCGEKVYRFEVVKNNSGCQYRDHLVTPKGANEAEILKLWNLHKELFKNDPPNDAENIKYYKTISEDGVTKKSPVNAPFWWTGLEIVPAKQPFGFLNKIWDSVIKKDDSKNAGSNLEIKNQKSTVTKIGAAHHSSFQEVSSLSDSSDDSCSSSNAGNSEESCHGSKVGKIKGSPFYNVYCASNRNEGNRFWLSKLSTRCNQDNQREFEERALRQIEYVLAKKLSGENLLEKRTGGHRSNYQTIPLGGIYVKLEQEWRESHCFSHGCPGSSIKARSSASHVNVNNSSFPVHKRSKSRGHR